MLQLYLRRLQKSSRRVCLERVILVLSARVVAEAVEVPEEEDVAVVEVVTESRANEPSRNTIRNLSMCAV